MKKGIVRVLIANIINLLIGLVNSFVLPKYLSVESYAMIKTYTLYISYAGFFHLGYLDGMYLTYGGKELDKIDVNDLGTDFKNIVTMQLFVSIAVCLLGIVLKDAIVVAFAVGLFFTNIISYYQMLFQAVGEFSLYSKTLNYRPFLIVIGNIILLFCVKTDNYVWYIASRVAFTALVLACLGFILAKRTSYLKSGTVSWKRFKENISSGIVLMLGNFSSSMFTGIDRWFVKILMSTANFAVYSFAVTIDGLITVFITPISITLYNALCKNSDIEYVKKLKKMILIWGFAIITAAFPAKWVLEHYIQKYIASIELIFALFGAQAMYTIIKGVYVNLYKAQKKQTVYFKQMIIMTIIAAVLDGIMYAILGTMISLALGTLITAFVWLVICETANKELRFGIREWTAFFIEIVTFLICGYLFDSVVGLAVYAVVSLITAMILMRDSFFFMLTSIKQMIPGRK